jgi:hypothetical protein
LSCQACLQELAAAITLQCKPALQQALDAESSNTSVQSCCMRPLLLLRLLLVQVWHP